MQLRDLKDGDYFTIPGLGGKGGVVTRQGEYSTTVRYAGTERKEIYATVHGDKVHKVIDAPFAPVQISGGTEVERVAKLAGFEVAGKRKRGRPKGSKNKARE